MKASQFFIRTLKEAPADAEIVSHKLMMRAGLIRKLGAGIYNYMPNYGKKPADGKRWAQSYCASKIAMIVTF